MRNHEAEFKLLPSQFYLICLIASIIISISVIIYLPITMWIKSILFICVLSYGLPIIWRYSLLRSEKSITHIKHIHDEVWSLRTANRSVEGKLSGFSMMTGWVSLLRFSVGAKQSLVSVIFRDSLPKGEYRKLLVVLRMF